MRAPTIAILSTLALLLAACADDGGGGEGGTNSESTCGDGRVSGAETCDDGNVRAFDGCGPTCQVEFCGDGVAQLDEECDDGELMAEEADVCRPGCIAPRCGDGIIDAFEACDDGNNVDDDGCAADCSVRVCRLGEDVATLAEAVDSGQCVPIIVPAGTFTGGAVFRRNQTVIGEGAGASVLDGGGTEQVIRVELGARVELQGLTIQNGRGEQGGAIWNGGELVGSDLTVSDSVATGPDGEAGEGGGIYSRGPMTLTDVLVLGNEARGAGDDPARGGGMYLLNTATTLDGCVVQANEALGEDTTLADGGGIYLNRGTLTLRGASRIAANVAQSGSGLASGGGLATARGTVIAEEGTAIADNRVVTSDLGVGGGLESNDGTIEATGLQLTGNQIEASVMLGAGAHLVASDVSLGAGTRVAENRLEREQVPELARGAGLYVEEGPMSLDGVVIEENHIAHAGEGAGLYVIATRNGVTEVDATNVEIASNTIAPTDVGRTTVRGAGLYVRSAEAAAVASVQCSSCVVRDNRIDIETVGDAFALGGGVYVEAVFGEARADVSFDDSLIRGNELHATADTAIVQGAGIASASTDDLAASTVTLRRTRIDGNALVADGDEDAEASGAGLFCYAVDGMATARIDAENTMVSNNTATATGAPGLPATSVRAWGGGGAVYATSGGDSRIGLAWSTVAGNALQAEDGTEAGGGFHLYPVTSDAVTVVEADGALIASNDASASPACHVQNGTDGLALTGPTLIDDATGCQVDAAGGTLIAADAGIAADEAGDWRPAGESAAIDGGGDACNGLDDAPLAGDLDGADRPQGAACDLGAFEVR